MVIVDVIIPFIIAASMERRCSADLCYQYVTIPSSWQQAASHCAQIGSSLATITSPAQQDFIRQWIGVGIIPDIWIGSREVDTGWLWMMGKVTRAY